MKMSVKGNVNINVNLDLEFELNDFESEYEKNCSSNNVKKVKLYDYKTEALLPIIKYYNKMALWFEKNGHFPKRKQEFFVYSQDDINFILSQVVNKEIVNISKYPDFDQCFWLTLKSR